MSKTINISSLVVGYQNKAIISNINVDTDSHKLIAIIGRNGSGKSTILKTLSGSLPPISGSFIIDDVNVFQLNEQQRSKLLSIVTTQAIDINNIIVNDFVSFGRYPYTNWLGISSNEDNKIVNKALELCSIKYLADRDYQTLSDGEKQRVNVARAIAQDTPLIILDEPTAHLDLINKIEVLKLLKTLTVYQNKSIIFSTHQIEYALQVCDEIWMIHNGELKNYTPYQIIEDNLIDKLIDSKDIAFDKENKAFRLL